MTSVVVWANRASGTFASSVTTGVTTVTLTSGEGALFPSPAAGEFFPLVMSQAASPSTYEIAYCTARSTDTLTILRGQEGTAPTAFSAGDNASLEPTAGTLDLFVQWGLIGAQTFTTSGTFTVPTDVFLVEAEVQGGGGSGNGCQATSTGETFSGAGGGAGGYGRVFVPVTPGQTITVTVGAGGTAPAGTGTGGNGGNSSFSTFCTSTGGSGAQFDTAVSQAGGPGGTSSGGYLSVAGGFGGDGQAVASQLSGYGGASYFGGGGRAGSHGGTPTNGQAPGSGGGGAYDAALTGATFNGGNGAGGIVIVRWG
jgi:hypothetical protein